MPPVEIGSIRDIKMTHKLLEIPQRSLHNQVEVIPHQYIRQDLNLINLPGTVQKIQKSRTILIIRKNLLPCVPSTGNMIVSIFILNP